MAVQNGPDAQPVLPSPATIADKTYAPLSRPLFIYVKNSAARRPEVAKFLKYYLENIDELAVKGGYDPPTAEDKAANQATLAKLLSAVTAKPGASRGRRSEDGPLTSPLHDRRPPDSPPAERRSLVGPFAASWRSGRPR